MSGLDTIETDKTYANSIVIVDASSNGHDWDGDPVIAESCSDVLGTMTAYLVDKGILPSKPNVVMMSEHQAMDALISNGASARIVESPLLVLVAQNDGAEEQYGQKFINWLVSEYYSYDRRNMGVPHILPVFNRETAHLPLSLALKATEMDALITDALVRTMERTDKNRAPARVTGASSCNGPCTVNREGEVYNIG